jgi:ABC-type branched-subunit amino acid transport system substrate-binding protein
VPRLSGRKHGIGSFRPVVPLHFLAICATPFAMLLTSTQSAIRTYVRYTDFLSGEDTMRKFLTAAVAAAAIFMTGPANAQEPPKDPEVFRFGAILAMSGKGDWYGKVMSRAVLLAVDEINARGGVDGIPLEAVPRKASRQ